MTDKSALRRLAHQRRAAAHGVVDPTPALTRLRALLNRTEGPVSFYWPIRSEIDPLPVMREQAQAREVCLPVTHGIGAPLTFRRWTEGAEMQADGFGVATPVRDDLVTPRVLVVPLLAFDDRCHRLGYGAGYYDRTLEQLREAGPVMAIGLAYSAQRADTLLPIEPTDQPLDAIVTEAGIIRPA